MADKSNQPLPCPPEVRGVLSKMDDAMSRDPRYNNAMVPGGVIKNFMEAGILDGLPTFEHWLREMGSKVHLIGAPLDIHGPEWADKTEYMSFQGDKEGRPDYTLWIGVNGLSEAVGMLARLDITPEENIVRLDTTGFLVA